MHSGEHQAEHHPCARRGCLQARGAPPSDRRGFLRRLLRLFLVSPLAVGFASLVATGGMWLLASLRFMFPNVLVEPPTTFLAGLPSDYERGQVETKYKARFGAWVVCEEVDGQSLIYALRAVCTHLGCTPNWLEAEQKFKCPCHGSGFYKDGVNFEGPAPRPLERFAIRVMENGQLEVDTSRLFHKELGQWDDPACSVTV